MINYLTRTRLEIGIIEELYEGMVDYLYVKLNITDDTKTFGYLKFHVFSSGSISDYFFYELLEYDIWKYYNFLVWFNLISEIKSDNGEYGEYQDLNNFYIKETKYIKDEYGDMKEIILNSIRYIPYSNNNLSHLLLEGEKFQFKIIINKF